MRWSNYGLIAAIVTKYRSFRLLSQNSNNFKSIESHLKKDIENLLKVRRWPNELMTNQLLRKMIDWKLKTSPSSSNLRKHKS